MPSRTTFRLALPLILGLTAGAALALLARLIPVATSNASAAAAPAPVLLPAWSWRDSPLPPALDSASVAAAVSAILDLRDPDGQPASYAARADALRTVLARAADRDFPAALNLLASRADADDKRLLALAFALYTERDSPSAARWAAATPGQRHLANQALQAWARLDALAAATWACALADETLARDLAPLALRLLADTDPSRALALAESRGPKFLDLVLPGLLKIIGKADPAAALRTFGPRVWKNGQGFHQLRELISAWAARDPRAALAWLAAQPHRDASFASWVGNLAMENKNPGPILTALAGIADLPQRQRVLSDILFRWGTEKSAEALAWLDALPDRNLRGILLERATRSHWSDNPEKSLPLALALPPGELRTERIGNFVSEWAKKDPTAALAWLRDHPDPSLEPISAKVNIALLASIARDEPATAVAEWAALPDGKTKSDAIGPLVETWGKTDPAAALRWAFTVTDHPDQSAGFDLQPLVYAWSKKEPVPALRWIEDQITAGKLDAANAVDHFSGLAGDWDGKAPRAATADLYAKIQDPALRAQVLTQHLSEWLSKDRPAAQKWLESNSALTPDQAARLLTR